MESSEFKERFLHFHSLIYRVGYAILENKDDAKDILQEVFIKLWNRRDEMAHVKNDEAFIITMTKNVSLDFLRSKKKNDSVSLLNTDIMNDESIETQIWAREELANVIKCMEHLPENQQKVIRLRHFADMSISEISGITNLTEMNVRQLLSRARLSIKEQIMKKWN